MTSRLIVTSDHNHYEDVTIENEKGFMCSLTHVVRCEEGVVKKVVSAELDDVLTEIGFPTREMWASPKLGERFYIFSLRAIEGLKGNNEKHYHVFHIRWGAAGRPGEAGAAGAEASIAPASWQVTRRHRKQVGLSL